MDVRFSHIRPLSQCSNLRGVRVLLRAGIDAPLAEDGSIVDDFRIRKSLPTLQFLRNAGARVIIVGHTSRADGSSDVSLKEICTALNAYLPVRWAGGILGESVKAQVEALQDGDMLMLENLRFEKGEKENDSTFARSLSAYADIYVNDTFSVSHREHASIVGVPQFLSAYAGQQFMEELENLSMARTPNAPSLFVIGGAKFETKLPLVEALLSTYDYVFIGGALANTFFKAQGFEVGESLVSSIDTGSPLFKSPKVLLPIDVRVRTPDGIVIKKPTEILSNESVLDAGPLTIAMLKDRLETIETLLWNGPLGDYEHGFDEGTNGFAEAVADHKGVSIVGGGDTVAAIKDPALVDHFTFLSTAGGAMLSFLEQGTLPGIEALNKRT